MKQIKVCVTQECLDKGQPRRPHACPIALAAMAALPGWTATAHYDGLVLKRDGVVLRANASVAYGRYIRAIDREEEGVKPANFVLKIFSTDYTGDLP